MHNQLSVNHELHSSTHFSSTPQGARNAILGQPVACPSNYKEKETAMFQKLMNTTDDLVVTLLRLVLGVVFFAHGAQKVLGWFGGFGFRATLGFFTQMMHIPAPLAVLAIAAEFLGGIGLVLGFLGRVAAFGIFCNMVVAIVLVHRHFGLFANWAGNQKGEGIEYHVLAIVICLAIMIRGSGALSIDRSASRQLGGVVFLPRSSCRCGCAAQESRHRGQTLPVSRP